MSRGMRNKRDFSCLVKFHLISIFFFLDAHEKILSHHKAQILCVVEFSKLIRSSIIKFIHRKNRFASLKSDLWASFSFSFSNLNHFLTKSKEFSVLSKNILSQWVSV